MRPFRFGVSANASGDLGEFARKVEDLGFSTLVVADHFGRQLAPLPALLAAALSTSTLRVGTIVLGNDFRHPGALAKEAATIDLLSGGRFELGLGAGWQPDDYRKTGIAFASGGVRLERLTETVQICKAFFRGDAPVSFGGRHFQIDNLDAFPRPVQPGGPPILIAGRHRRILSMAAREADIVGIAMMDRPVPGGPTLPSFAQKVAWVREAAGARFSSLDLHVNLRFVEVTDQRRAALERIATKLQVSVQELEQVPRTLVGSIDSIVEQVQFWRETTGLSYMSVPASAADALGPVISRLRAA